MATRLLPRITTWEAYRRVFPRGRVWIRALRRILARHRLHARRFVPTFPGTAAAIMAEGAGGKRLLVKLVPPMAAVEHATELRALAFVHRSTGLRVPRVVTSGVLSDRVVWRYLVIDPVDGTAIRACRGRLARAEALDTAAELGSFLRALHAAGRPGRGFPGEAGSPWRDQSRRLISRAVRACAKPRGFPRSVRAVLGRRLTVLAASRSRVVLVHGDVTEDHVMLVRSAGRWRLAGLIDFADARIAPAEYELMPLWFGALGRDPGLLRRWLAAYSPGVRITRAWRDRALAFSLVHRFGAATIIDLLQRERKGRTDMTWDEMRDWLWPSALERGG